MSDVGIHPWMWRFGLPGWAETVWILPEGVVHEDHDKEPWEKQFADSFLQDWDTDSHARRTLEELQLVCFGVEIPLDDEVSLPEQLPDLRDALREGRLVIWGYRRQAVSAPAVLPNRPVIVRPSQVPTRTKLTWYEVRVVDELGEPVAGAELELRIEGRKDKRTTDGNGKVRLEQLPEGAATLTFTSEADVRQMLRERWSKARMKEWVASSEFGEHTEAKVRRLAPFPSATAFSEEPHTIVLQPRVVQAVLYGMWFDTSKSFLLPTALPGVRFVTGLYQQNPGTDLLVVGHTDTTGNPSYNDLLSLERAKAVVAYLKNDTSAWLDWYGANQAPEKRWGVVEDDLMIRAVTSEKGESISGSPVRYYQITRGLTVDGVAGVQTRSRLVNEYMAIPQTSLPDDVLCKGHGCGENFPPKPAADGTPNQENRSVEVFFFDNPTAPPDRPSAVLPEPPGDNSKPGAEEYPEWLLRAKETKRHEVVTLEMVEIQLHENEGKPIFGAHYRASVQGEVRVGTLPGATLLLRSLTIPAECAVEWSRLSDPELSEDAGDARWMMNVHIDVDANSEMEKAVKQLHNIGYRTKLLENNVAAFQRHQGLPESGELDPETRERLQAVHEQLSAI